MAFVEIVDILPSLSEENQLILVNKFTDTLVDNVKQEYDLVHVLDKITTPKAQEFFIAALANKIQALISSANIFCSIYAKIHPNYRYKLMFDVIGLDTLRNIVPGAGQDRRAREGIVVMLAPERRLIFLDALVPEEEKSAKIEVLKIKEKIIATTFSLGLFGIGWGGADITLDNGKKKSVPNSVARQWDKIKDAEAEWITYVDAWKKINEIGVEAANATVSLTQPSTVLTYLSRQNDAIEYYKSFQSEEKVLDEQSLTLQK